MFYLFITIGLVLLATLGAAFAAHTTIGTQTDSDSVRFDVLPMSSVRPVRMILQVHSANQLNRFS